MTCRDLAGFLSDYLSGDLDTHVRERFDGHLAACINCRRYLANYTSVIELGRRAFKDCEAEAPTEVPAELVQAIIAARTG